MTTPDLLEAVLPDADPQEGYKWLADRSFVEPLAEGIALHALVAQAVRESLRRRDPVGEGNLRRRIADHVHRRAVAGQFGLSADLQHLVVDQAVRWGLLVRHRQSLPGRHRPPRRRRPDRRGDGRRRRRRWWATTRVYFDEHPQLAGVARDRDGKVCGYYVAVSPDNAPPLAADRPAARPVAALHPFDLRTSAAVLWREAVDLTGEMGEVTALLGSGGAVGAGVANPRYGFLPIAPDAPGGEGLQRGARRHPRAELDFDGLGMQLECHVIDFGPGGVLGFQRDWIYRETGAVPPGQAAAGDAVDAGPGSCCACSASPARWCAGRRGSATAPRIGGRPAGDGRRGAGGVRDVAGRPARRARSSRPRTCARASRTRPSPAACTSAARPTSAGCTPPASSSKASWRRCAPPEPERSERAGGGTHPILNAAPTRGFDRHVGRWPRDHAAKALLWERTVRMRARRTACWPRLAVVIGLIGAMTLVTGAAPVGAAAPTIKAPTRIYGLSGNPGIPVTFLDVPDLVSAQSHDIKISNLMIGNGGCNHTAGEHTDGCPSVKVDVTAGSSNGKLRLPGITEVPDSQDSAIKYLVAPGGAFLSQSGTATVNDPTSLTFNIVGTPEEINLAYDALQFQPNGGYQYIQSADNGIRLHLLAQQGDASGDTAEADIEIRIQLINVPPTLVVPGGPIHVTAGRSGQRRQRPAADAQHPLPLDDLLNPPLADFFPYDVDLWHNDQDDQMLLLMTTDCGQFHVRSASLGIGDNISDVLSNQLHLPAPVATAIVAVIPDALKNLSMSTSQPTDFTPTLIGFGSLEEVEYALSE